MNESETAARYLRMADAAEREVSELRATLAFYADPDSYEPQPRRVRPVIEDAGAKARVALGLEVARAHIPSQEQA